MADIQPRPILITGGGRRIASPWPAIFWPGSSPLLSATAPGIPPSTRYVKRAPFVCTRISALTIAFWRSPKR
ncbi:Uncharacterised protein [Klebsiella michiganensis]|uniref:Uncharacterized protein n=1 Tax=Klebsiella michiganensis TaxID=1134687 RepID=A0A7H4MY23_9ENTR|nr:Uncharacterised protein [Klebsiella michiganensis]